jgi:hypothetical protein
MKAEGWSSVIDFAGLAVRRTAARPTAGWAAVRAVMVTEVSGAADAVAARTATNPITAPALASARNTIHPPRGYPG